ncbi:hypothetical protein [Actinomadura yumaensis]|uniref:Uncharacterized protein n=1 Tax=Actinomadura yumaensis TaxID=111807 RepID=A0ABW2CSQ4_9ACTN
MTTPEPPTPLIVSADDVAVRARLPTPLPAVHRMLIEAAIRDAQEDLEGYLGRPLSPRTYTDSGVWPNPGGGWTLTHDRVLEVLTAVPEVWPGSGEQTGMFTVTYRAGLDAANDPELAPIRRFVRAHAQYSPEVQRLAREVVPDAGRVAKSASTDGQSATWEADVPTPAPGSGVAGELPTKASCDRWRIAGRRVSQRPGVTLPWPYDRPGPLAWVPPRGWGWW